MKNVLYVIFLLSASMCFAEEYIVLRSGGFSVAHHSGKVITRDVKAGQIVEKIPGLNGEKHKKIKYSIHVDGYSGLINFEGIVSSENVLAFDDFTYKKCFGEYQKIVKFKSSVSAFKMADHDNSYWVILLPDGSFKFKGLLSDESTVFTCRPVADNKQYVASLHAGHKKGVISVRDRTQFPTSKRLARKETQPRKKLELFDKVQAMKNEGAN